jgi:hypothetical protein
MCLIPCAEGRRPSKKSKKTPPVHTLFEQKRHRLQWLANGLESAKTPQIPCISRVLGGRSGCLPKADVVGSNPIARSERNRYARSPLPDPLFALVPKQPTIEAHGAP